jgi:hypothetical protein
MGIELVFFLAASLFAAWVVLFGGAFWLEDTITSAFLVDASAPLWSAAGIRLYVGLSWIVCALGWALS